MKKLLVLAGAGFILSCGLAAAQSQPNPYQGTPGSAFPEAAPNEVQIINGVPCRTVLTPGNVRVPVQCAGPVATGTFEPSVTGSIRVEEMAGPPAAGVPLNPFPYAAPHEIRIINGVPCRTVLVQGSNVRVPVECAR